MQKLIKHLFPKPNIRQRLPLLPRVYSSHHGEAPQDEHKETINVLKGHGVARTDHDAMRLIRKHQGKHAREIVKSEKRKRKPKNKWLRAWRRLKGIW